MSDLIDFVHALRRPRLLIRAAIHGLADYNRDRTLGRLTRLAKPPSSRKAVTALLGVEERLEFARLSGDAAYSASRHVEVMIALLAEARLLAPGKLRA